MPVDTRLNGFGFELKLLSRRIQAVIPNWHTPYSIDTGDLDRDDRAKMLQMRVLVRVDVNDDEHDAVIDITQHVTEETVKFR